MSRMLWCFVAVVVAAGCDPNAKANANDRVVTSRDRLSKLYETCAATGDCAEGLRCFQSMCRATEASVVGDYYAAVGAQALAEENAQRAIEAYTAAVNRYESDKIDVPLEILCGKGQALAAVTDDRDKAEQAARTLHECLRQAPVGSVVRGKALTVLARLGRAGLDPELLARDELMSQYLTKQPAKPATSSLKVEATGAAKTRARSYTEFLQHVQSDPVRDLLVPCWEMNWKASKQKVLSATLEFKYWFYEGYEPSEDRDKMAIKSAEPAAGTAERCVYDALGPVAEEFSKAQKGGGSWSGKVTLTIQ